MSNTNWMRQYSLTCGPSGKKGFEIGNAKDAQDDCLRVSFSVEKCDSESANTAKVQIWNLAPSNLKILDQKNCVLELRAGYSGSMALILKGDVETVTTTRSDADRVTEIEVTDGGVAIRNTTVNVSFNKKVNCKKVYEYIASKMGVAITWGKDLKYKTLPNGFSFVGAGSKGLKKLTKICGHSWSIQNGVLQIVKKGKSASTRGYVLSAETGLLGVPKKITIATSNDKKKPKTGYEIKYLLNGAIGVNDTLKLQSSEVSGDYRVYKVTFDGDNMDGDWICTAQIIK